MLNCDLNALKTAATERDVIAILETIDDEKVDRLVVDVLDLADVPKSVKAGCARYCGFYRLKQEVGEATAKRLLAALN
jgi:hypothetical protein